MKLLHTDPRVQKRLDQSIALVSSCPDLPFPKIFTSHASLIGFYRLMNNTNVSLTTWVKSLRGEALKNTPKNPQDILCLSDTTELSSGRKLLPGKDRFFFHASLICGLKEGVACGLLGAKFWSGGSGTSASERWLEQAVLSQGELQNIIHVMDSEADKLDLLQGFNQRGFRYVIRSHQNRTLKSESKKLIEHLSEQPVILKSQAHVAKRKGSVFPVNRAAKPPRDHRVASLNVQALSGLEVTSYLSKKKLDSTNTARVNYVRVFEPSPPAGQKPVEWILATSEPTKSHKDLERVASIYKKRWLIEEFFKALKTGCKLEERQFETLEAWKRVTVFLSGLAVKALNLRYIAESGAPVENILSSTEYELAKLYGKKHGIRVLGVNGVLKVIARLVGHIKTNGPPGWIVLMRGLKDLQAMAQGVSMMQDLC